MQRLSRKVFVSGSSYIISLPKEWVVANSIKPGDTVFCTVGKTSILIQPHTEVRRVSEAVIEDERDRDMLIRKIISHYLAGYTTIRVKADSRGREGVYRAVSMLIGAEILEDSGNSIWIEIFTDERRFRVEELLEKMSNTVFAMIDDFGRALVEFDRDLLDVVIQREQEIDRLYFLILRLLKSAVRYPDVADHLNIHPKEVLGLRITLKNVERVGDHIHTMAINLKEYGKAIPELEETARVSGEIFRTAMNSFFKIDEELAREVFRMVRSYTPASVADHSSVEDALKVRRIQDGFERILGYSEDIAEIVLNLSV
ncbi:Phosphate uptake regulator [Geoglobus ahangari]|uniref:Phosphate uptake regulator n=1 Tax=Geoglobus ahangari TaxID=113653 RepID=A0A0F7DBD0_9EURY|nr:phosphate uptake regulator PhoU [Geoglobus ahangari]AKG90876.1 Phosphate uptake regulator [Geoglobus ahangari]